jgi:hypothetical protein
MGEIINLREFRKKRKRKSKSTEAAGNRSLHGQSKDDAARHAIATERADAEFDGKQLERAARESRDSDSDELE